MARTKSSFEHKQLASEVVTLPETVELPSAECIPSGTRQTSNLLSVFNETLGKHIALGKTHLCRVLNKKILGKLQRNTRQTWTLGKVEARALGVRRPCDGRWCATLPL